MYVDNLFYEYDKCLYKQTCEVEVRNTKIYSQVNFSRDQKIQKILEAEVIMF